MPKQPQGRLDESLYTNGPARGAISTVLAQARASLKEPLSRPYTPAETRKYIHVSPAPHVIQANSVTKMKTARAAANGLTAPPLFSFLYIHLGGPLAPATQSSIMNFYAPLPFFL